LGPTTPDYVIDALPGFGYPQSVRLDERTKKEIYTPVFILFGVTFLLVAFLLAKRVMNRGDGSKVPNWARPAVSRDGFDNPQPRSLPPHEVKRIEPRKYRRRPSQTLRRPPTPGLN
jgi:hypothetical protein